MIKYNEGRLILMEFTIAQIKDFAVSEAIYEAGVKIAKEKAIVSLEIDDFSNAEIILINATVQDDKQYHEVNMSVDKDDYLIKAHMCSCKQHIKNIRRSKAAANAYRGGTNNDKGSLCAEADERI